MCVCKYESSKSTQLGWKFEQKIQENFEKNSVKTWQVDLSIFNKTVAYNSIYN